jgi:hypothetical protein
MQVLYWSLLLIPAALGVLALVVERLRMIGR